MKAIDILVVNELEAAFISGIEYTGNNPNDFAFKMKRGVGINGMYDGLLKNNTVASYIHTHTACIPEFAYNFTQKALE